MESGSEKMKRLEQTFKDSPDKISDAELALFFVDLMEFPTETFASYDVLDEMHKRENPDNYEILRSLAVYYSHLNGDFFGVGEGSDYYSLYLRAVEYAAKALAARSKDYDIKIERYGEFADSYIERDFLFSLGGLLEEMYQIKEMVEDSFNREHELFKKAEAFAKLRKNVSEINSPLDTLKAVEPDWNSYLTFVREVGDASLYV